jgi:AmmeMemoRadiSam system protein B
VVLVTTFIGQAVVAKKTVSLPVQPNNPDGKLMTEPSVLVVPHHDLIRYLFPNFYEKVQNPEAFTKVLILSPNHFQTDSTKVKIRSESYLDTNGNEIPIDRKITDSLAEYVVVDNEVFDSEHGVQIHLPFIAQYFPDATVTSMLFTRVISSEDLRQIETQLKQVADEQTLIIVSTDFSHYLGYADAQERDKVTLRLMREQNNEEIASLNDEYLDCPTCLYLASKLKPMNNFELVFYDNSYNYLSLTDHDMTTSYFVLKW